MTAMPGDLSDWVEVLPFAADPFQLEAIAHIEQGRSVVVTAPTGAGKTLIAEAAVARARQRRSRAFYTTPLKALSNQKFGDLAAAYGDAQVGLLTGDNVINGDAPIVVMTTEVLRNMIYADAARLDGLAVVVLDEVHFLQDRYRGSVWEEVIIHLPRHIQLVSLSATVANAREFTDWVEARRGDTALVEERHRPVPLQSVYMIEDRHRERAIDILPVFDRSGSRPNPAVVSMLRKGRGRFRRFAAPRRLRVVEELARLGWLPAIYFIFSRAGCSDAAAHVAGARPGLTTAAERAEIVRVTNAATAHLDPADLGVLGFDRWLADLEEGMAAHHAGMVPAFKETVETLFASGLIKVVFATETLALGINMPAKAVVLERLSKFDGESHELLRPGDYTQLTGRAGRRGIDRAGTAVVLHQPEIPFDRVASIAAQGSHPLTSSFNPTYNMAVNLVATYPRRRAEDLIRASFAQHRLQRQRAQAAAAIEERRTELAALEEAATCNRGDITAYATGRAGVTRRMRDFAQGLVEGTVLGFPGGERVVMLARGYGPNPRLMVVDEGGRVRRLAADELSPATVELGVVALPEPWRPREKAFARAAARLLTDVEPPPPVVNGDEVDNLADPVATCPDLKNHLANLERAARVRSQIERMERRVGDGSDDLVDRFRAALAMLDARGYTRGWSLTERGERLRFVYNELDLLVAESIHERILDHLTPAELAAAVSVFVYERRRGDVPGGMPSHGCADAIDAIFELWERLAAEELRFGVDSMRAPDDGYVERIHRWASGATLEDLFDDESSAGDFVRLARQTLDLLRQVRDVFPALRDDAAEALRLVDRGVVMTAGL
ncbi:MAG: DEAD/DEAH box helicase [Acidimicrobiia bacterium]|nr:DEAD/DEAH box helicase [Acidimicrobiia bacterium]